MSIHLSDNQRMLMMAFNNDKNPFSFWDGGFKAEDSGTWESSFIPEITNVIGKPESSAKRTLNDLIKKGIFTARDEEGEDPITDDDGNAVEGTGRDADRWIELTDAGVEMISDLRIEEDEAMLDMDDDTEDEEEAPPVETLVQARSREAANARIKEAREKETKGRKKAAQEDIKQGKPTLRTSHAECGHATSGKEGKIARAKCRRERAAKLKEDAEAKA